MASTAGKRPLDHDGEDNEAKRMRSNNGSPVPTTTNGVSEVEKKKQDAHARVAAVKARLLASKANATQGTAQVPSSSATVSGVGGDVVAQKRAEAQRKIEEVKARVAASRAANNASPPNMLIGSPHPPPLSTKQSEKDSRIAEARAKVLELAKRDAPSPAPLPPPRQDGSKTTRGGMGVDIHPLLRGDLNSLAGKGKGSTGPKFSTTKGNQQHSAAQSNRYLTSAADDENAADQDESYDPTLVARKGGDRKSKQLIFNQRGKFMAQANALRQVARMEEMKKRIAAETRKTEIEEASDKAFLVPMPPEIEWWDEGLMDKIDTEDTIVTALVQHPVILQAPQDKYQPAPKPLMLTPSEQKKLRRQRRMADMKEEQAKIRLGLVEPPPPKVKKSNMMRVLGEQAVKDPTAVEARVNREIAQRASDHAQANADRQLTKEQRAEKLKQQQAGDDAKGIRIAVFRVDNLSSGKHRYQVDVNAKQNAITGMVILHPEMNLILVEGGRHSITAYKKLMLNRIKWAENTLPLSNTGGPSTFTGGNDGTKAGETNRAAQWLTPVDERGELKDLANNRCQLIWEGEESQRSFKRWGSKACETDGEARDALSRSKMENMWTLARSMSGD